MTAPSSPLHPDDPDAPAAPADFWEQKYAATEQVWSGRVNPTLQGILEPLAPGRALDLGCGEGGDALWLAGAGWQVLGVDISPTAIARARRRAQEKSLAAARFDVADLTVWDPAAAGPWDLVTASFLQSPVALDRSAILRRACGAIAPGGHLVALSHAAPPPWAQRPMTGIPAPHEEFALLELATAEWTVETAEVLERHATGPDGQQATLRDNLLVIRRR